MTLIIALFSLVLLSALGTSLSVVMNTELRAASNYTSSREAMYAADGVLEIAAHELLAVADWNALLAGGVLSPFVDGPATGLRQLGDGTTVELAEATNALNSEPRPWGANNPVWRLFAFGWLGPTTYVIAWVADDSAENDGDPLTDGGGIANPGAGIVAIHAEAFGAGGAHKALEAAVRRDVGGPGGPVIRALWWQHIR
jgi:hypothetical protein